MMKLRGAFQQQLAAGRSQGGGAAPSIPGVARRGVCGGSPCPGG